MVSTSRRVSRAMSLVTTLVLGVTCLAAVTSAAAVATGHVRVVNVLTGSMAPGIPVDTLVIATPVMAPAVHVGQIIMFMPPPAFTTPGTRPVIHRVASVATVGGVLEIRTKGDANTAVDPWILDANRTTLFTPVLESPVAGKAAGALGSYGLPVLAVLLVLALVRGVLRRIWSTTTECDADPAFPCGRHSAPQASVAMTALAHGRHSALC
jgi:signal peptidase I